MRQHCGHLGMVDSSISSLGTRLAGYTECCERYDRHEHCDDDKHAVDCEGMREGRKH